jgi:antitoxin component YwqK of YwqJK toxin-antitoxin module
MRYLALTSCLFLLLVFACNAQVSNDSLSFTSKVSVNYNDLVIKESAGKSTTYLNDLLFTGVAKSYFSDGKLQSEEEYVDGKKEGEWTIRFKNGNVMRQGYLKNGKEDGEYKEYFENGNLRYHYHYNMGVKNGKWLGWYENGILYTERNFENNTINGKIYVWDESGKLTKEFDYEHGKLINSILHDKMKK